MSAIGAVTNRIAVRYGIEPGAGMTPINPLQTLHVESVDVGMDLGFTSIESVRADRQNCDNMLTDATPKGTIGRYMDFGAADDLKLLSLQASSWTGAYQATGASVSNTTTYTVPSATGVVQGHIVQGKGFANSPNNGLAVVTATTGTTIVVSSANLTTETSGPAKTVAVIGYEGTNGDIAATATGLASTMTDFTTLGLRVGQFIKIGGASAGARFATTALNDFARVIAIAPHVLTLDHRPNGWVADAGTGKTIRILFGEFIRNGVTDNSLTIEVENTDVAGGVFDYQGYQPDSMQVQVNAGQPVMETYQFKGLTETQNASTISVGGTGAIIPAVPAQAISGATGLVRFYENGAPSGQITSLTLQISNGLREQKAVGTLGNAGIGSGTFKCSLQAELYFEAGKALSLWQRANGSTITNTSVILKDPTGNAYVLTQLAAKVTKRDITRGKVNQDCKLQVTIDAQPDSIGSHLTGGMFQIDRIPNLGA